VNPFPSPFEHVDVYDGDPILSLIGIFQDDQRSPKVNLGVGLYYDEDGNIPLLDCVRAAEVARAATPHTRSYQPVEGSPLYRRAVQELVFGADHVALTDRRVATIQSIGGSGALKVGADFLRRHFPASEVWFTDPTWENHIGVFEGAGFTTHNFPYYDPETRGLRFEDMMAALAQLPALAIVVLHPCCHNPTGVDLTAGQWQQVIDIARERGLIPFLDLAYQGFGDGLAGDAFAVRAMASSGVPFLAANSFAKNMSYYGERCGALSVVCATADEADRVLGQLKLGVRMIYSSPPVHGGEIAAAVLTDPQLRVQWEVELSAMRERIVLMRMLLHDALAAAMPDHDFGYLLAQRGMFSYTGLTPDQVDRLRADHAVYLLRSGRMCVAGINHHNVDHVTRAFTAVLSDRTLIAPDARAEAGG
jgi:aromatic-amino-acid transaminase